MVHTERGNHALIGPGGHGMPLAWLKLERSQRGTPLPLAGLVHTIAVAGDRLHAALERVDSRGRRVGAPHGEISHSSIVLMRDGGVLVRRAFLSLGMTGESPRTPEQSAGGQPTARSDVFGLALVLYELITGKSFGHMITPTSERPPGPAPDLALPLEPASRFAEVPSALDAVLQRALATDPAERYADTRELAVALRGALNATREDAAALMAAWYTAEREREHQRQREEHIQALADATSELEKLIAEAQKQPLRVVPPQPPPEDMPEFAEFPDPPKSVLDLVCTFDEATQPPRELSSREAIGQLTQLASLGFERLGLTLETDVLADRATPGIVFASPAERGFAAMFVSKEGAPSLFFVTRSEGRWVITSSYARYDRREPRVVQTGHPGKRVADVLAAHRSELRKREAAPIAEWDRAAWLAATDAWYASPELWP